MQRGAYIGNADDTRPLGLYCHVPFCVNRCSYCAFYKEYPSDALIERYLWNLEREFDLLNISQPFNTIYVGGGTPGVLSAQQLTKLGKILTQNNQEVALSEFSIEFSPATVREEKIEAIKFCGFNRVTMGVQSFNSRILDVLGRKQTPKRVHEAYETIISCGFENVGLDLIFGVPGQTIEEWLGDLRCAVRLQPKHISTYNLTFEDDTPLKRQLSARTITKKSDADEVKFSVKTWNFLMKHGFHQYEISNFCVPGFESVHNVNTWKMHNWVGIGPSSCSQRNGYRFSNPPLREWTDAIGSGKLAHVGIEKVKRAQMFEDSLIFGLRMNVGVDLLKLKKMFHEFNFAKLEGALLALIENRLLEYSAPYLKLTAKGRLLSDAIAVEIIGIV